MKNLIKKVLLRVLPIPAAILIFWLAVSPLFHPGLFPTIDNISVVRIESMSNALRSGQFPVRISEDLSRGRGYMLFNFYAPLPFYTAAALYESGVNLVGSLKRAYLFAFIFAAIGMFIFAKEFFGKTGGAVSSTYFTFSPFLGYDVYWRGGVGEVWAISFFPFLFWGIYKLFATGRLPYIIVTSIAMSAISLSHNLSTYIILPFAGVWIIFVWLLFRKNIIRVTLAMLLGFGVSAFFWLPAFTEKSDLWVNYLQSSKAFFMSEFIQTDWQSMFFPTFIPMMINWVYLLIPIACLVLLISSRSRKNVYKTDYVNKITVIAVIFTILSIFMATELSRLVWDLFYDYLYILQFSWRFFIITTFFSSFLAGFLVISLARQNQLRRILIPVIMIIGIVWYSLPNFRPTTYEFVDKYRAEDPCGTTWGYEYLPTWVSSCIRQEPYVLESVVGGSAQIGDIIRKPYSVELTVIGQEHKIRFEKYYYPGWYAYINGKRANIEYNNQYGLIEVPVPAGKNMVAIKFEDTPLRKISNLVSLLSLIILGILFGNIIYGFVSSMFKRISRGKKH